MLQLRRPIQRDRKAMAAGKSPGSSEPVIVRSGRRLGMLADHVGRALGWRRHGVALVAGALSILAFAPFFLPVILFATLPVLIWLSAAPDDDGRKAGISVTWPALRRGMAAGWWFGFGFHLAGLYWIGGAFLVQAEVFAWLLPFAVTLLPAGLALFHGAALACVACVSGPVLVRLLVLAAALGASEWLRGNILTGFPWNALGYALTYPLVLMQSAGVVGIYGLTLLTVVVFASPVVLLAAWRGATRSEVTSTSIAIGVLTVMPMLAMVVYGWLVLSVPGPGHVAGVTVRLVQPSIVQADKFRTDKRREIFERHLALSVGPAGDTGAGAGRVTHVIWPEAAMPFLALRSRDVGARIAEALPDDVVLIAGTLRLNGPLIRDGRKLDVFNSAIALKGDGRLLASYDKVHLVPFGEYLPWQETLEAMGLESLTRMRGGFAVGRSPRPLLNVPGLPPLGLLICYEVIFPDEIVVAGQRPGLLINLTNDAWYGTSTGPFQHFHQARVRSVEQGLPMIRVGNNGISGTIDARGRVLGKLGLDVVGALDTVVPRAVAPTIYAQFGDAAFFVILIASVVGATIVGCNFGRRRRSI